MSFAKYSNNTDNDDNNKINIKAAFADPSKRPSALLKYLLRPYIIFIFFLFIGLAVYQNSFDNPYYLDDDNVVVKNLNIRSVQNIPLFFFNPRLASNDPNDAGHYRPLVVTSYAVNYALGGLNPAGYHLVSLLFHAGSAFLVFLIVKKMLDGSGHKAEVRSEKQEEDTLPFKGRDRVGMGLSEDLTGFYSAIAAGLIFLVHPFNSEAVNYITARSSLMSGFFYLLGFWSWIKFREHSAENIGKRATDTQQLTIHNSPFTIHHYYITSFLAFIAGMLCKEVVITLPIMFWLYDIYFKNIPKTGAGIFSWRYYVPYLPFVLIVIIPYFLVRFFSLGKVLDSFQRDLTVQLLTEVPVFIKHWQMFFFPKGLSLIHDVEIFHNITGMFIFSLVMLLLYLAAAVYLFIRKQMSWRLVSFFMFWFFIVLLPTTIVPLNTIFQENRGYLAIVSFVVPAGIVLNEAGKKSSRKLSAGILIAIIIACSVVTIQRNEVWGDSLRLWNDAVEKAPGSAHGYVGLAEAYREHGDYFLSYETVKKGAAIAPDNFFLATHLAVNYYESGDIDGAIEQYKKAINIDPKDANIWNDLAILYNEKGDYKRALICIREGLNVWRDFPPLYDTRGLILSAQGNLAEAVEAFRIALMLNPDYVKARYDLAESLEVLGKKEDAIEQYREVIRIGGKVRDTWSDVNSQDKESVMKLVGKASERLAKKIPPP